MLTFEGVAPASHHMKMGLIFTSSAVPVNSCIRLPADMDSMEAVSYTHNNRKHIHTQEQRPAKSENTARTAQRRNAPTGKQRAGGIFEPGRAEGGRVFLNRLRSHSETWLAFAVLFVVRCAFGCRRGVHRRWLRAASECGRERAGRHARARMMIQRATSTDRCWIVPMCAAACVHVTRCSS